MVWLACSSCNRIFPGRFPMKNIFSVAGLKISPFMLPLVIPERAHAYRP